MYSPGQLPPPPVKNSGYTKRLGMSVSKLAEKKFYV